MKIEITIPDDYDKQGKKELFIMFEAICDNIGTDGLQCKRVR